MQVSTLLAASIIFLTLSHSALADEKTPKLLDFYPEIEPFKTGYLKVSDLHEIYYELCGNPDGKPVMVLHGGPGGGSYPTLRRYHDPAKYLIVLHDQRGAGRSKPHCELRENNTQELVEDIEKLRIHLKLGKVQVFGGSWGSTLGLAYAETHPESVDSLVIRGVFTATKEEIEHFFTRGVARYYPEAFGRLQAALPEPEKGNYAEQMYELLRDDDAEVRRKAAYAWAAYEMRVSKYNQGDADVERMLTEWDPYDFSLIENYYMVNRCFLEEGQLLRNAGRLADIPTYIVNGRYDMPCPPITAWRIYKALPKSELYIIETANHSGSEPETRSKLIEITRRLGE